MQLLSTEVLRRFSTKSRSFKQQLFQHRILTRRFAPEMSTPSLPLFSQNLKCDFESLLLSTANKLDRISLDSPSPSLFNALTLPSGAKLVSVADVTSVSDSVRIRVHHSKHFHTVLAAVTEANESTAVPWKLRACPPETVIIANPEISKVQAAVKATIVRAKRILGERRGNMIRKLKMEEKVISEERVKVEEVQRVVGNVGELLGRLEKEKLKELGLGPG
jgi:hypothetical protein